MANGIDHKANDETAKRLKDLKAELKAKIWPLAIEAGAEYSAEALRPIIELRAQI
jgi:hypothetical protein